jgi:hypothetical protein
MLDPLVSKQRRQVALGLGALAAGVLALPSATRAQERFSLFVASSQRWVDRLIEMSALRDDDFVVDLGSGDGRIVLSAVRANPQVRGFGVDIQEDLVRQSNEQAIKEGLADRVKFLHQNVFDADLSKVTVIYMWLFPELMRLLRPKILAEARPGTRVLTHMFDLGSWRPDERHGEGGSTAGLWIVPARVDGFWTWNLDIGGRRLRYDTIFEQRFQDVEGITRVGNRRGLFTNVQLRGEQLSFTLDMSMVEDADPVRHQFSGRVRGDKVTGTCWVGSVEGDGREQPWQAQRTPTTQYFRFTGVDTKK